VAIALPTDGTLVNACANVSIIANAVLLSGSSLVRMDYYADGVLIGSDDTAPYEITFVPGTNSSYSLTAVATDNLGSKGTSPPVIVNVLAVNHAPTFTPGSDVTVNANSGAYSNPWASNIDDGEPCYSQQLAFIVSNGNPGLFSTQPAIDANGVLSFTAMPDFSGPATVTVTLMDDGGTANGGADSSVATSFMIVVNPLAP
jgi:hypothetical protein